MESGHPRHPSFGLAWEFVPGQDLTVALRLERKGFSHWALRLETHLKYGGPLGEFLQARARQGPLRFVSDYLPVAPVTDWDPVHELATIALLNQISPLRLTCRRPLPQIPMPNLVLGEMLAKLPLSTEINLQVQKPADFELVRRSGEVSASLRFGEVELDEVAKGSEFGDADLITEIWVDPLGESFAADRAAKLIARVLEASSGTEALDVTFELPERAWDLEIAVARAEQVRDLVLSTGWSTRLRPAGKND